jgi:rod shape determining protein RodA
MARRLQWGVIDLRFILPWILILCTSLIMLNSITSPPRDFGLEEDRNNYTVDRRFFHKQALWVGIGLMVLLLSAMIPFWFYKDYLAWLLYGGGVLLLLSLLILPPMRGETQRWLAFGPVGVQPSEFFKVVMIIMLASFLASRRGSVNRLTPVLLSLGLVLPPMLLILKQPDLGTALSLCWLLLPMLIWRGLSLRRLLLMSAPLISAFIVLSGESMQVEGIGLVHLGWGLFLVLLFLISLFYREMPLIERIGFYLASIGTGLAVPMLWAALRPYQQKRILVFFNPNVDPLGAGYHVFQSKVAIGSGGLLGRGYLQGTQKGLAFLPARHTDFIFSVLGEEFGFLGAILLLLFYATLIWRGFQLAGRVRHPFAQLLAVGASSYLLFHVMVNVGMTTGLLPVTGLPLPGMSFGGSALVSASFLLGMQMNISRNWARY